MNSSTPPRPKLSPLEISTLALMGALIFGAKFALASLPNVNINAVLIILTTLFFGWRALYAVAIYVLLEGLVFGLVRQPDRKSTRLNSSHPTTSRMPSSA